jgi:hypothetical protein
MNTGSDTSDGEPAQEILKPALSVARLSPKPLTTVSTSWPRRIKALLICSRERRRRPCSARPTQE